MYTHTYLDTCELVYTYKHIQNQECLYRYTYMYPHKHTYIPVYSWLYTCMLTYSGMPDTDKLYTRHSYLSLYKHKYINYIHDLSISGLLYFRNVHISRNIEISEIWKYSTNGTMYVCGQICMYHLGGGGGWESIPFLYKLTSGLRWLGVYSMSI